MEIKTSITNSTKPNLFLSCLWRLTPLGRVRLALAYTDDLESINTSRKKLKSSLKILAKNKYKNNLKAASYLPLVYSGLIPLALKQSDLSEAELVLNQFITLSQYPEQCILFRKQLIVALIEKKMDNKALEHIQAYISDKLSTPSDSIKLLTWAAKYLDTKTVITLAESISQHLLSSKPIETIRILFLYHKHIPDSDTVKLILTRTDPHSLTNWPKIQGYIFLLRTRCFEIKKQYELMLIECEYALTLLDKKEYSRYWHARALIHNRQYKKAMAELENTLEKSSTWERLERIAKLFVIPDIEYAEACLNSLESHWSKISKPEKSLALSALNCTLKANIHDSSELLGRISSLCKRILNLDDSLSWAIYNVALGELITEKRFESAYTRLKSIEHSQFMGESYYLLSAICTSILGYKDELGSSLQYLRESATEISEDCKVLELILTFFDFILECNEPQQLEDKINEIDFSKCSLLKLVPVLDSIANLLKKLVLKDTEDENSRLAIIYSNLAECQWAKWLCQRFQLLNDSVLETINTLVGQQLDFNNPFLTYDRLAWLQEYASLVINSNIADTFNEIKILREKKLFPDHSTWIRLQEQRGMLLSLNSKEWDSQESPGVEKDISWLHHDYLLKPVHEIESEIEWAYLIGRHCLRNGNYKDAVKWFRQGESICSLKSGIGQFIKKRHDSIFCYWEGVAQAHRKQWEKAKSKLEECQNGPKANEAYIQQGLICIREGKLDAAKIFFEDAPRPWPVSRKYLGVCIAMQKNKNDFRYLTKSEEDIPQTSHLYRSAIRRLLGSMAERTGKLDQAREHYLQALDLWGNDFISTARLARISLYKAYPKIQSGLSIDSLSDLSNYWSMMHHVSWARNLENIKDCIMFFSDNRKPESLNSANGIADQLSENGALKRLQIRALITLGKVKEVESMLDSPLKKYKNEDSMMEAIRSIFSLHKILRADAFKKHSKTAEDEITQHRHILTKIAENTHCDPSYEFWRDIAQLFSNSTTNINGDFFITTLNNKHASPQKRLFAAIVNLFSSSQDTQTEALKICQEFISSDNWIDKSSTKGIECLIEYFKGNDHEFLSRYKTVEEDLSSVPCSEEGLYIAASEARLRTGKIEEITNGYIPDLLADLTDINVRKVIGKAYAIRAAKNAGKDVRAAITDLEQAIDLLSIDS